MAAQWRSPLVGLRATSYAENAVCLAEAKATGASEAVLANLAGNLCEGTGSNVFAVIGSQVFTPPVQDGCLAGITRDLVIEWCDVGALVTHLCAPERRRVVHHLEHPRCPSRGPGGPAASAGPGARDGEDRRDVRRAQCAGTRSCLAGIGEQIGDEAVDVQVLHLGSLRNDLVRTGQECLDLGGGGLQQRLSRG